MNNITLCSGIGQHHTNEADPKKPEKKLQPYLTIDMCAIKAMVDKPQQCDKPQAQWLIPSTHLSRNFKEQEANGKYWLLWGDLDKKPPPLLTLSLHVEKILSEGDFELYNSRSATVENQKARLLILLDKPLCYADWNLAQQTLNDKFEELGIIPDRTNERSAQLCYLPNKGELYSSESIREGKYFGPMQSWAQEIAAKREKLEAEALALAAAQQQAMAKKATLRLPDNGNRTLSKQEEFNEIKNAFNQVYTPQEWLLKAGYAQRGNSFRHPHSESGNYSATVKDGRVNALSSSDLLYSEGKGAHDAFSVYATLSQGGDNQAAAKCAGDNLLTIGSLSWNRAKQLEWGKQQEQAKSRAEPPPRDESSTGNDDMDSTNLAHDYPIFDDSGFYGIAGEVARLATEHSEADKVAVYFSFLTASASMLGRFKYLQVGDSRHYARLFSAVVGASSRARKGTSFKPVERIIRKAEDMHQKTASDSLKESLVIANGGLSSAEGLIYAVRDESDETKGKDNNPLWLGVDDKRLLVVEEELGGVLKVAQREGNLLSQVLRKAWDGGTLAPMTKNNRMCSTDPHINAIGHITQFELKELLSNSDIYNGLANRFLWACVRRTKKLSNPQPMDGSKVMNLSIRLASAFKKSKEAEHNEIELDIKARELWDVQYHIISTDRPGVIGTVTARNEAHVLRLALLFCLLDGLNAITTDHLKAAIAVVNYSTASCEFIFTVPTEESPDAQKLLSALDVKPMTQTEISRLFNGHKQRRELTELLTDLQTINKIRKQKTPGSKTIIWEKIMC